MWKLRMLPLHCEQKGMSILEVAAGVDVSTSSEDIQTQLREVLNDWRLSAHKSGP